MCDLLEKAREAQGGISYYELAKRLGIGTPLMNKWKNNKSQPNGLNTLKLVNMAKLTPEEAIKILEKGSVNLGVILTVALTSLLLFATCPNELKAAEILSKNSILAHDSFIHYAKLNKESRFSMKTKTSTRLSKYKSSVALSLQKTIFTLSYKVLVLAFKQEKGRKHERRKTN